MSLKGKKVFTRKSSARSSYKWAPTGDITDPKSKKKITAEFCNAQAYSVNGEDTITGYISQRVIVNGVVKHYAYIACDYIQ